MILARDSAAMLVGERRATAVEQLRDVRVVAPAGDLAVHLGLGLVAFGNATLGALVEHGHDGAYDLQVAQLLGGDVDQHVLAAGVVLGEVLREIAAGRGELALRATERLEHEVGQSWVGLGDADGVLQALVVGERDRDPSRLTGGQDEGFARAQNRVS